MVEKDLQTILDLQIGVLLEVVELLDDTYMRGIPYYIRPSLFEVVGLSQLPNIQFAGFNNGTPANITYVPKRPLPLPKTIDDFMVIKRPLQGIDENEAIALYNAIGNIERLAILNTQRMIQMYSQILCVYFNGLSMDGPKFGDAGRQIAFSPNGATENAAWFHTYRHQFYVSMSTFCKAISDVLYGYGIHQTAKPIIKMQYDLIGIQIMFYDLQGRPAYVKPKITN